MEKRMLRNLVNVCIFMGGKLPGLFLRKSMEINVRRKDGNSNQITPGKKSRLHKTLRGKRKKRWQTRAKNQESLISSKQP